MNVLVIFLISVIVFALGYRFYARYIEKIFDVDGTHITRRLSSATGLTMCRLTSL